MFRYAPKTPGQKTRDEANSLQKSSQENFVKGIQFLIDTKNLTRKAVANNPSLISAKNLYIEAAAKNNTADQLLTEEREKEESARLEKSHKIQEVEMKRLR